MSEFLQTQLALAGQLDSLILTAIAIAGLGFLALCRQYWVYATTPSPVRLQPWYPIPDDLPAGPVAPYGARALQASYRPAMSRGIHGSTAVHVGVLLAAITAAELLRKPPMDILPPCEPDPRDRFVKEPIPPPIIEPDHPTELFRSESTLPPPPIGRLVIPVPDARANPHSTILGQNEEDLGLNLDNYDGPYDLFSRGLGTPDGRGHGTGVRDEEAPVALDIVQRLPELVLMPEVLYPETARDAKVEGLVELDVLVGRDGRVRDARITKSIPALDGAARAAALKAVFRPALWQDQPVAVRVTIPIRFSLND